MFVALHPSIGSSVGGCLSLQSDTFAWIPNDVPDYLCSGISSTPLHVKYHLCKSKKVAPQDKYCLPEFVVGCILRLLFLRHIQ